MPINRDYIQFLESFDSQKFRQLWPAQVYVLNKYSEGYTEPLNSAMARLRDVAIELPTGAGKTLITLLIAEAWRVEGKKVAILSANKTLARQMLQESQALGIPSVLMEGRGSDIPGRDKRAYHRAQRVAIMNYWVYFNQKPVIDPANLLIMDDAHLAEHCLHSLYSVEIKSQKHSKLFKQLVTELNQRFPEYSVLTDALSGDNLRGTVTELLSFVDQVEVGERIREIIDNSPCLNQDQDLHFRWIRTRDRVCEANIYMSINSIWIRPYIYPLMANEYYQQVEQHICMSATIGEASDLSRRLGIRNIEKMTIPVEYAEKTSGRRLIVMNQIGDKDIPERSQKVILEALRIQPKSIWLCSSEAEALKVKQIVVEWLDACHLGGHPTWLLTPLGNEIDEFKEAHCGHLFVAGRFDGMDFKADECRLVIVMTLPRAVNSQEEFISAYLRDSGFMKKRLNQRIIQALGRCNRSDEDYGVYVLADKRFATHFGRESNRVDIPRDMMAEIDMAQDLADSDVADLVKSVHDFLSGDFAWYDRELSAYIADVPERSAPDSNLDKASDEVLGWTALFSSKNYEVAGNCFEKCWKAAIKKNLIEIGALQGWQWAKALYLQSSIYGQLAAREKALSVFENAINRGGNSAWFNRMRASLNRARNVDTVQQKTVQYEYAFTLLMTFDEILEEYHHRFERWCQSITTDLESESHAQYQRGLENLGIVLGYQTPPLKHKAPTDCLWRGVFGNAKEIITFEAKIEHEDRNQIAPKDIGQAHTQLTRAKTEYERLGYIIRATMVTHLTDLEPTAESSAGEIKILRKEAVINLWNHIKMLLGLYKDNWSLDDISIRLKAASSVQSRIPGTGWLIRAIDVDKRFIDAADLLLEWS